MPNTIFMEPGTDATQDFSFFSSTGGTVASATDQVYTGARSCKLSSGNPAVTAYALLVALADTGRRISFRYRADKLLNNYGTVAIFTSGAGAVQTLRQNGSGKLFFYGGAGAVSATGATVLAVNTWYRISISYTITSTTSFRFDLYINGVRELSQTTGTLDRVSALYFQLHLSSAPTDTNAWYDDIYIDDGSDYSDPGNICVAAKRPNANGTLNEWTTQIGAGGSGYGSGHSPQVNEQPLSSTNGWSIQNAAIKTEHYAIEDTAIGDVNISGNQIVDSMGWAWAKVGSASTGNLIVNGAATAKSVTTSYAMYTQPAGTTAYLSGATAIGMDTNTVNQLFSLAECGVLVAYYTAPLAKRQLVNQAVNRSLTY